MLKIWNIHYVAKCLWIPICGDDLFVNHNNTFEKYFLLVVMLVIMSGQSHVFRLKDVEFFSISVIYYIHSNII